MTMFAAGFACGAVATVAALWVLLIWDHRRGDAVYRAHEDWHE